MYVQPIIRPVCIQIGSLEHRDSFCRTSMQWFWIQPTKLNIFLTVHCFEKVVSQGQFSLNKLQIGQEIADNTKCNDT